MPKERSNENYVRDMTGIFAGIFSHMDYETIVAHGDNTTAIEKDVIEKRIPMINRVTEQENDPRYWAYLVQMLVKHPDIGPKLATFYRKEHSTAKPQ